MTDSYSISPDVSKDLFLIRGLPGSGKSTLGEKLRYNSRADSKPLAADDYFYDGDGVYQFDPSKLADAHLWCQEECEARLAAGLPSVIIANTFSCRWEIEPYLKLAKDFSYTVTVLDLYDNGLRDEELVVRNTHGVPLESIVTMRNRWEHDWKHGRPLPPWEQ